MIDAAIIGGGGFTAGELIRILLHHPEVNLKYVMSNSQVNKKLYETHKDLIGDTGIIFTDKYDEDVDVIFLCKGHGQSISFIEQNPISLNTKIIDLSRDFRLMHDNNDFVYGLPELNRLSIKNSNRIANPGCFATAIQLALLPLAAKHKLGQEVHIQGVTGATGAGQAKLDTTHFSWRNNNFSIYKAFKHQHLTEVEQMIQSLTGEVNTELNFIPMRGDFTRGILISAYTQTDLTEESLIELYNEYYAQEAFTHISPENIHLKQVVNTNKCIIHVAKHRDKAFVISAIDNLLKGASGQAVQNMNIIFGINEHVGLNLKAMAY